MPLAARFTFGALPAVAAVFDMFGNMIKPEALDQLSELDGNELNIFFRHMNYHDNGKFKEFNMDYKNIFFSAATQSGMRRYALFDSDENEANFDSSIKKAKATYKDIPQKYFIYGLKDDVTIPLLFVNDGKIIRPGDMDKNIFRSIAGFDITNPYLIYTYNSSNLPYPLKQI